MEDFKRVVFDRNPEQAFFAIFDGHGGGDAADFARKHLWDRIKQQKGFYSGETSRVTKAIKDGFVATHREMWKHLGKLVSLSCHFALDTETCGMAKKDTLHDSIWGMSFVAFPWIVWKIKRYLWQFVYIPPKLLFGIIRDVEKRLVHEYILLSFKAFHMQNTHACL